MKDYNTIQRYGMVDKYFYDEEPYREMGKCEYGEYVLYSDYLKLLNEKRNESILSTKDATIKCQYKSILGG